MENEKIIIKSENGKNGISSLLIIAAIALLIISFIVAYFVYENGYGNLYLGFGNSMSARWCYIYSSFFDFYITNLDIADVCIYPVFVILAGIAIVASIVIKIAIKKSDITVTEQNIYAKIGAKNMNIPLDKVTGIHKCAFNGINISVGGSTNNFYCLKNREDIVKAVLTLLSEKTNNKQKSDDLVGALEGLKNLLDTNVITQEEFDIKKKELLE